MNYSERAVDGLIRDYRRDFGVHLAHDDAIQMMVLVDLLADVFEKYENQIGDGTPGFFGHLLGL
jgi:hypothetical protein